MNDNELADADERAQLHAEIERLSGELAQVREILGNRENDITRLRAALRRINNKTESVEYDAKAMCEIARAALEGKS